MKKYIYIIHHRKIPFFSYWKKYIHKFEYISMTTFQERSKVGAGLQFFRRFFLNGFGFRKTDFTDLWKMSTSTIRHAIGFDINQSRTALYYTFSLITWHECWKCLSVFGDAFVFRNYASLIFACDFGGCSLCLCKHGPFEFWRLLF